MVGDDTWFTAKATGGVNAGDNPTKYDPFIKKLLLHLDLRSKKHGWTELMLNCFNL